MHPVLKVQSKNGEIFLGGADSHERLKKWLKFHDRKRLRIEVEEPSSYNMQKFFEGAVVPFFALQHPLNGKHMGFKGARDALKREFNPVYVVSITGDKKIEGGSLSELYRNKAKMLKFMDRVQNYFLQNGYEFPDSEDYKKWRDSAPDVGEIYPPLKRLFETMKKI